MAPPGVGFPWKQVRDGCQEEFPHGKAGQVLEEAAQGGLELSKE